MGSLVRKLTKDTLAYGLSTVAARAVSVLLLPVYTRYLTPADYGVLQLLELAAEVTSLLFVAGTRAGMLRFFYKTDSPEERKVVVSSTFLLEATLALLGGLALVLCAEPVWRFMLTGEGSVGLVRLAALNFIFNTLCFTPFALLQAEQKARAYSGLMMLKLAVSVMSNLLFLVYLGMGVEGMLLSSVVVNALFGVALSVWLLRKVGFRVRWSMVRALRSYGLPYQLTTAGAFILTFGDRFFLQRYQGATQVGLYAFAYQFGFLLYQLGGAPFLKAWLPERHRENGAPEPVRQAQTQQGFLFLNLIVLSLAVAIALFARPAVQILTAQAYHEAVSLIPIVLLAYVFQVWTEAIKFGIDVSERTIYYTYASWAATAAVLLGYVLLIPSFGAAGAAWATVFGFLVRFVLTYYWSNRLTPLDYNWAPIRGIFAAAVVTSTVGTLVAIGSLPGQLALGVSTFAVYLTLVWLLVVSSAQRVLVREKIRRVFSAQPS